MAQTSSPEASAPSEPSERTVSDDTSVDVGMSHDEWKAQGNKAFQAEDYGNAIVFYTNGIEACPSAAALFSNRSAAHLKMGDTAKARRDADMCIELDRAWAKGWWRRGQAQMDAGEYMQARETYREGLLACPGDENLEQRRDSAQKRVDVIEGVQGGGEREFDLDGESRRTVDEAGGEGENAEEIAGKKAEKTEGPPFPNSAEEEIKRIQTAPNHYAIMHVSPDSPPSQIKKNYHVLARLLHPDKCHLPGASEAMGQVSLAYDTLTNVVKKTLYDQFMSSKTAEDGKEQTYAEWEAKQQPVEIPKWLAWLLSIRGCGWFLAILMTIIVLPIIVVVLILFLFIWCLCCPYRTILRYCFPEKYAQKREAAERQRAKDEEAALDRQFPV